MKFVLRLVMGSILVLAAFLAVLQILFSEAQLPLGTNATMSANFTSSTRAKADVLADLAAIGEKTGTKIFKVVPDLNDSIHGTDLYVIAGEQPVSARPISYLDPSRHGLLYGAHDLGEASIQGQYALQVGGAGVADLKAWGREHGVELLITTVSPWQMVQATLSATGSWIAALAGAVLVATSVLSWFASRSASRAYRLLHGHSRWRIHLTDVGGFLLAGGLPLAFGTGVVFVVVAVLRGPDHALRVVAAMAVYLLAVVLLLAVMSVLVSWLTRPTVAALAERRPSIAEFESASSILKLVAVAVSAASVPLLISSAAESYEASQSMTRWTPLSAFVGIRLGDLDPEHDLENQEKLGRLVVSSEAENQVALSLAMTKNDLPSLAAGNFDAFVVTNEQFRRAMAGDPALADAQPIDWLAVPEPLRTDLEEQVPMWLRNSGEIPGAIQFYSFVDADGWPALGTGASRFVTPRNALIMVVPNLTVLDDDFLTATVSTQNIIFQDPVALQAAIDKTGTGDLVVSIDRIGDTSLVATQFAFQVTLLRAMSVFLIVMALVLSGAVAAQVYAVQNVRRYFPQRTAGWSWEQVLRSRLLTEIGFAVAVSGLAAVVMVVAGRADVAWVLAVPTIYIAVSYALHRHYVAKTFNLSGMRKVAR